MKGTWKMHGLPGWMVLGIIVGILFSCGGKGGGALYREADSLNLLSYRMRYKNLDTAYAAAQKAFRLSEPFPSLRAEALNNLGFCAFIRMDFDGAGELFRQVYDVSGNELECLVADVGMMKICQRTAMNKEFYDYRYRALNRMKRIDDDRSAITDSRARMRLNYARSEFAITSAVYYYYLQQEEQSIEAIDEIKADETLANDTAQLLCYYYMKGSGGMYEADTPQDVAVGEFDYLMDCLDISHKAGYIYFEANASQALAELLNDRKVYDGLVERRPARMRAVNVGDLPWEELTLRLAEHALALFRQYGDWYQISGSYRTLASCSNEQGCYEDALDYLSEALDYVNLHHETYYLCTDSADRLYPYVPMDTTSVELAWIKGGRIKSVPEWIARLREQLSVTYAALGMKPQSDYNRNIYLDILDYTRQDKELESRFAALEQESKALTGLLVLVIGGIVLLVLLFILLNRRWRVRNALYIGKLKQTLEICRKITSSVPADAGEMADVTNAITAAVREDVLRLFDATAFRIVTDPVNAAAASAPGSICTCFALTLPGREQPVGRLCLDTPRRMKKDDKALMQVINPYLAWTLENGLTFISLGEERKRLEKEQYVHEQHRAENKRQNVVKKACLFLVTGIMPYIDRVVNEVRKLTEHRSLYDEETREGKYRYIDELVTRINEYNDILDLWIRMRQGAVSLNIENFALNPLFDMLAKGRKTFEMKRQTLTVESTEAVVKADKALTLFMINTLAENARKYTQAGGHVTVSARETDAYVEISVTDDGPGLSAEDVACIEGEKVYDSGKIGWHAGEDTAELRKNKGHGFGLMNCKGIIEKYRKTNDLFRVCLFRVESRLGEGSRFYFRLPKGVRKALALCLLACLPFLGGCGRNMPAPQPEEDVAADSIRRYDKWLAEANDYAYDVYNCNIEGQYQEALGYADSAFYCLNEHYKTYSGYDAPLLSLEGEGASAELTWFDHRFDTDYYTLLDVRNESAVAFLALGNLEAYRYNNNAYTALYKQISKDTLLEQYCTRMQLSAGNKTVAIALCVLLVLVLLLGYYLLYFRHRLMYRYNLEQVLEINRQVFSASLRHAREENGGIAACLVREMFGGVNELLPIDTLGLAVWHDDRNALSYAFSSEGNDNAAMREAMAQCFASKVSRWTEKDRIRCLPLWVETGDEPRCTGILAVKTTLPGGRESDRLMLEIVAGYVAIRVYNVVVRMAQKYRDIESTRDEMSRAVREENQLHVQNLVLDNCLSTIKHETIYYPHRIRQIMGRLNVRRADEQAQVETIGELIGYYKDIFTLLSSCAARQLEEITFRRGTVQARDLANHAVRYLKRAGKRLPFQIALDAEAEEVAMLGDVVLLKFLLENLIDEALSYEAAGRLALRIRREGNFARFDFWDSRREKSAEELNQLFYPHLSRMKQGREGAPAGTEYLICKQIIRDHDEYAGRRGCRINARPGDEGGFVVWFTIPLR